MGGEPIGMMGITSWGTTFDPIDTTRIPEE